MEEEIYGDFVTVAQFGMPYQAHLLAGSLEAEGIMAFIKGENVTSIYPFLTGGNNGIHVQVRQSQVDAAREIIRKMEESTAPSGDLPQFIEVDGKHYQLVNGTCIECSQNAIYLATETAKTGLTAVVSVVIGVPLVVNHNYICYNCHYNWHG